MSSGMGPQVHLSWVTNYYLVMWGYKVGSPCFGIEINITGLGDEIPFPAAGRLALVPVCGVVTSESDQQADDDLC